MTKKEAIMVLQMVKAYGLADEAKQIAIKALQIEPTNGRPIDADALMEKLTREIRRHDYIEHVYQIIDDAPTVQADRPHGEWVDEDGNKVPLDRDGYPLGNCYCNQCHEWLVGSDEYAIKGNFCPACGADMRKRRET